MALTPPLGGFEIIFVDNGSTDCSLALARQYPVTVLQEPKRGRSTARNAGIRIARGSLIAFVDADCVVETNWLCRLVDAMCPEHVGGAQGAFIVRRDEPKELSAVGPGLTSYFDFSGYLPVLATGGCIYRREILNRLNGFDERLNSFEDVDLTWRVVFLGYSLSVVSDVVVYTDAWLTWKKSLGRTIECFWATFTFKAKWRKTRLPRFHRAVGRELQAIAGRLVRVFEKSPGHVRSARIRTAVSRTISLFASCASFLLLRGDCVDGEEQDQRGSVNWGQLSFDGATYQMASHVRAVFEPHLAHIIDLTARTKMPLNLVAATILGAVFSGVRDVNAIVELVREVTTGATEEDARRDTTLFLMDLIEKSILVKTEE
jgi:GT2 family glycosyltransferase